MKITTEIIKSIEKGTSETFRVDNPRDLNTARSIASYVGKFYPELGVKFSTSVNYSKNQITITAVDSIKKRSIGNSISRTQNNYQMPVHKNAPTYEHNTMQIDKVTLGRIIAAAVDNGVAKFCERNGIKTKDEISQRQAFKLYGEFTIRKWELLKKITPQIVGNGINSKKRYSRSQIELQKTLESTF